MDINGLVNLNKPSGMTSRRAVDLVQRLVRPAKVGHAGTLDPLASGVLIVGIGSGTRLMQYIQDMPKRYHATFLLGRHSPTEDIEGPVTELVDPPEPSLAAVTGVAREQFTGVILQRPPAYSALKVEGRRAYDLARRGEVVELAPRPVTIYRLEVEAYAYPELRLVIECSGGTYVRSLGRDLAVALGTAAVMSQLTRAAIGGFRIEQAVDPRPLSQETLASHLQPMVLAVERLPKVELTAAEIVRVRRGQTISRGQPFSTSAGPEFAALDHDGLLVAVVAFRSPTELAPSRVFSL